MEPFRTEAPPPDNTGRRLSVCVLDDDVSFLNAVRRQLAESGFAAAVTTSPDEALRIALADRPDAMLIDLHLYERTGRPREDGIGVLGRLREAGYAGPAFVLSGDGTFEAAHRAARAGADGYLVKGPAQDLADALRRLLERAKGARPEPMPAAAMTYLATRGLTALELALAFDLATDGASEKEIAARSGRSPTAVRKGFESIRKKLGATSQHDLARMLGVLSCLGGRW